MEGFKKYFTQLIKRAYPDQAKYLVAKVDSQYAVISKNIEFAATSKNPLDKRLGVSAYFLAFVMILAEEGKSFETIRSNCLAVVKEYVRPKNKVQQLLMHLPVKLINTWVARTLIQVIDRRISQNNNTDGFVAHIITDKAETYGLGYGVDILECGICKLFKKFDAERYTSILCEVDEITSHLAGLQLVRSGTIALGAKKCDFRFKKIPENHPGKKGE